MLNQFIAATFPHLNQEQQQALAEFIAAPQEGQDLAVKLGFVAQFRAWMANK